ncbi:hypothetical protein HHK36_015626 [Tetracentron sinense]|uniref:Peroxidase n=1 Tax=Tetracentron sinense TaxID=13715 RepID=A0A834Z3E8_TETSI|nr:hypothetical protein HHK36_015626 [Tetracentron sinense]
MEVSHVIIATVLVLYSLLPSAANKHRGNHLHVGFYDRSCPEAEQIVGHVVSNAVRKHSSIAPGLIRLHFHDCFVNVSLFLSLPRLLLHGLMWLFITLYYIKQGCDASILLDATPSGEVVEKESPANGKSLRGLEVIDQAKARLEHVCPRTVSCADILAFAARDAAVLAGLLHYHVPAGRRDGRSSRAADTFDNLPPPSFPVDKLTDIFTKKGLTQEEMVTLSGAHSIGAAHCFTFDYRLYNFNSTESQRQDPSIDVLYAYFLKLGCPEPGTPVAENSRGTTVPLDSISPATLDNMYYMGLMAQRGLLASDQALANDPNTRKFVREMALNPVKWSKKFGKAMIRLGRVDVLTRKKGEIRNYCRLVN